MDRDSHVTLAAQVRAQLDDMAAIYDRIVDREQVPGVAGLDSVALHVVRHAYSAAIDERQLRIVLEDARAVRPLLRRDMEAFLSALDPGSG